MRNFLIMFPFQPQLGWRMLKIPPTGGEMNSITWIFRRMRIKWQMANDEEWHGANPTISEAAKEEEPGHVANIRWPTNHTKKSSDRPTDSQLLACRPCRYTRVAAHGRRPKGVPGVEFGGNRRSVWHVAYGLLKQHAYTWLSLQGILGARARLPTLDSGHGFRFGPPAAWCWCQCLRL